MDWYEKDDLICVPVYKDTTGQYTDEECDDDNCADIPVPMSLMKEYFDDMTEDEIRDWAENESICDETVGIIDWLAKRNFYWKRLK